MDEYKEYECFNDSLTISTRGEYSGTVTYHEGKFLLANNILVMEMAGLSRNQKIFIGSLINKLNYGGYSGYPRKETLKNDVIELPKRNNQIDFEFMDTFIAELEAERIAELSAYLKVSGLDNYELSVEELKALRDYDSLEWKEFNLEKLFGKSTRGKRLRSLDRISGDLPFVTAGETNTGISAYISNEVEIFKANTVTIDMFGSAKYRNYDYGADDHIAVVHTEKLNKFASLFTTAAIHKASYSGKFSYDKNFYAKDADELVIALPVDCQGVIQYDYMSLIASAIQKLVIKDVVKYTNERIETAKEVVTSHNTNY
ncbi:TPA: restriction endonuclease subunit S [Enterococcus faecalis]|nr:restriction endonuclease subunit S [Enterococcus faecalis]HDT7978259.1 restriction endonuclease subunit S [Enterococcus faecalis]HDT7981176.1 restriction endonuclease subunit S [Enterococcus faecalis]